MSTMLVSEGLRLGESTFDSLSYIFTNACVI